MYHTVIITVCCQAPTWCASCNFQFYFLYAKLYGFVPFHLLPQWQHKKHLMLICPIAATKDLQLMNHIFVKMPLNAPWSPKTLQTLSQGLQLV